MYHSSKIITTAGTDVQTVGPDWLHVWRAETRVKNHPKNKTAVGVSVARLCEGSPNPLKVRLFAYSGFCCAISLHLQCKKLEKKTCVSRCKDPHLWLSSLTFNEACGLAI